MLSIFTDVADLEDSPIRCETERQPGSFWVAEIWTPRQATEALSSTALTLKCGPLRAQLMENCPGCVESSALFPSLLSARTACIFFGSTRVK